MATRLDYAKLSMEIYEGTQSQGWELLVEPTYEQRLSGFYAAAYRSLENPNEVVIAFRGTEPVEDLWDDLLGADGAILQGAEHQQFVDALEFALTVRDRFQGQGFEITVTGHSLGGGLAQLAADVFGWGGQTFEAPGMAQYRDYTSAPGELFESFFAEHPELSFGGVGRLMNWTVFGSAISSLPGAHIGEKREFSSDPATIADLVIESELPLGNAAFLTALANWSEQLGEHRMPEVYRYFQGLTRAGRLVQTLTASLVENGVAGYDAPERGLVGDLGEFFGDWFAGNKELTQIEAEQLIEKLQELKGHPEFQSQTALLDDLVKSQDMLRVATQDIESVSVDNHHWTEQPGPDNEVTIGHDNILGDTDYVAQDFDWSYSMSSGVRTFTHGLGGQILQCNNRQPRGYMARPLRTELTGGLYHVTSWGDRRQDIDVDKEDGSRMRINARPWQECISRADIR